MLRRTKIATASAAALTLSTMVIAQQGQMGTAQEAKALLERAIPVVQADKAAAFAKFNKGEDGFKDRDLYVFCFDSGNGTINSGPATLIGHDVRALKDKNGDTFGQRLYDSGKEGTFMVVSYKFPRPGSTDPVSKNSYVTKIGDQICGVGYYAP